MDYTIKEKNTLNSLLILFSLMNKLKINFFLDSGTLLKFIRNNKKLTIGSDIDIGVHEDEKNKIKSLKSFIEKKGFRFKFQNNFSIYYDFIRIDFPKNLRGKAKHIDLYIYKNINGFYVCKRPHKFYKKSLLSKFLVRGLNFLNRNKYKKIIVFKFVHYIFCNVYNFFGKSIQYKFPEHLLSSYFKVNYSINKKKIFFNIPKNYNKYLSFRYTSNWRFPDKNWKKRPQKFIAIDNLRIKDCTFQN